MTTHILIIKLRNSDNGENYFNEPLINRIEWIADACKEIDSRSRASKKPDKGIRGIIVAPEYFLSKQLDPNNNNNVNLSIERDDMLKVRNELIKLSRKYKGIVFAPGTIAYTKKIDLSTEKGINRYRKVLSRINEEKNPAIWNPVTKQFLQATASDISDYKKYWMEKVQQGSAHVYSNSLFLYYNGQLWKHRKSTGYYENGVFDVNNRKRGIDGSILSIDRKSYNGVVNIDNRIFGLEICLEHNIGVLKKDYPDMAFDFQIIVSDYVGYNPSHINLCSNGLLIGSPLLKQDPNNPNSTIIESGVWDSEEKPLHAVLDMPWCKIYEVITPNGSNGTMRKVEKEYFQNKVIK